MLCVAESTARFIRADGRLCFHAGPSFATTGLTHKTYNAFLVGLATRIGSRISKGLAEALSGDGEISGRGNPLARRFVIAGMLNTLPFLITDLALALKSVYAVVAIELVSIAYTRSKFMKSPLTKTILQVIVGGGIVCAIGVLLGGIGAG